jgi:hypothetical protein
MNGKFTGLILKYTRFFQRPLSPPFPAGRSPSFPCVLSVPQVLAGCFSVEI